jgi:hypothetical protein
MICYKCKGAEYIEKQCFSCHGSGEGWIDGSTCPECSGLGTERFLCGCQYDGDYDDRDGPSDDASCVSELWLTQWLFFREDR